ncbi:hypothetical protein C8J57DRAFT_86779 [Mycena rebaudengoi]|nr:hypothetical protein C8J57DRAFT_86779 [Mycena rebaudengoi]
MEVDVNKSSSSSTYSSSQTKLITLQTQMSSTSSLVSHTPSKNFESAFATLQSTYGYSGNAPTPTSLPSSLKRGASKSSASSLVSNTSSKDFEAAFATLQSTYGYSGNAPNPTSLPSSSKQGASKESSLGSLFAKLRLSSEKTASSSPKIKVRRIPPPHPHATLL